MNRQSLRPSEGQHNPVNTHQTDTLQPFNTAHKYTETQYVTQEPEDDLL